MRKKIKKISRNTMILSWTNFPAKLSPWFKMQSQRQKSTVKTTSTQDPIWAMWVSSEPASTFPLTLALALKKSISWKKSRENYSVQNYHQKRKKPLNKNTTLMWKKLTKDWPSRWIFSLSSSTETTKSFHLTIGFLMDFVNNFRIGKCKNPIKTLRINKTYLSKLLLIRITCLRSTQSYWMWGWNLNLRHCAKCTIQWLDSKILEGFADTWDLRLRRMTKRMRDSWRKKLILYRVFSYTLLIFRGPSKSNIISLIWSTKDFSPASSSSTCSREPFLDTTWKPFGESTNNELNQKVSKWGEMQTNFWKNTSNQLTTNLKIQSTKRSLFLWFRFCAEFSFRTFLPDLSFHLSLNFLMKD